MKRYLFAAVFAAVPFAAPAASVDLTDWIENGHPNNSAGTWVVQSGNDSVRQTINGAPTVFFNPNVTSTQGTLLAGEITAGPVSDDDFIGFVLGYSPNEINSASADFWLVDWKQGNQSGQTAGLALSHVSGDLSGGLNTGVSGPWWQHDAPITEVARGTSLGTTGYNQGETYEFELVFQPSLIQVKVNGTTEISYSGSFTDGSFGFYNFSMANVLYAGITEDVAPPVSAVPLPATLPMVLAGLGALGLVRRRKRS
ncbi:MAG: VPLPA-CTERM sorting domain-containing protein [Rhodovulum sp.]